MLHVHDGVDRMSEAAPPPAARSNTGSSPNLAVRLTPEAIAHVRRGHPWVFDGSITSVRGGRRGEGSGEAGDLAVIFDDRRRFVAVGLWDPGSPIPLKVLHTGSPRRVGGELWRERLRTARAARAPLVEDPTTTAWRVLNGEGDAMPGLVVDRYGAGRNGVLVVKVYSQAWIPHLGSVTDALVATEDVSSVVLRLARSVAGGPLPVDLLDGATLHGRRPARRIPFRELGLAFEANVVEGQKTGWFLDQRDNRRRVGAISTGARVLDVFCCGGGFGVHAAAGGATSVHSVDASPHAVEDARRHLDMNRHVGAARTTRHRGTVGDAFEVLDELRRGRERYDVIVVDPPNFASRRSDVDGALRAHSRLAGLAAGLLSPGGTLVQSSCSSRLAADDVLRAVRSGAERAGVAPDVRRRTGQPIDHPVGPPETAYLLTVFLRVRS